MAQWGGVAMLVLTGLGILLTWLWIWAGLSPRMRRISAERLYPLADRPTIGQLQVIIWPIVPLVGLAWIATGALVARTIIGRGASYEASMVIALFIAIALVALWCAFDEPMPQWAYPGWMTRRFYEHHPDRIDSELPAPCARRMANAVGAQRRLR